MAWILNPPPSPRVPSACTLPALSLMQLLPAAEAALVAARGCILGSGAAAAGPASTLAAAGWSGCSSTGTHRKHSVPVAASARRCRSSGWLALRAARRLLGAGGLQGGCAIGGGAGPRL